MSTFQLLPNIHQISQTKTNDIFIQQYRENYKWIDFFFVEGNMGWIYLKM